MGLISKKFPAFSLEFVGEEIRSMINPELASDMDLLCDVVIYMEYSLHSMKKIVEINKAEEKLAKCREEIEGTDWWKERRGLVDNAKTADDVWPFIKKTA